MFSDMHIYMNINISSEWAKFPFIDVSLPPSILFFLIFFNIYLFLRQRETEHEQRRVRERGRHRIWNRLQALSCQHRARHGARTHGPRDRDLSWSRPLNWLSHPGAPGNLKGVGGRKTEGQRGQKPQSQMPSLWPSKFFMSKLALTAYLILKWFTFYPLSFPNTHLERIHPETEKPLYILYYLSSTVPST